MRCHSALETRQATASLKGLLRDQRGMSTVEYVVLLVFIAVGAIGMWQTLGNNVKDGLQKAKDESGLLTGGGGL